MTTKKPKPFAERLREAEREHRESVVQTVQEIAELRAFLARADKDGEEAEDRLADVRAGLAAGVPDIDPSEITRANEAREVAELRRQSAQARLQRLLKDHSARNAQTDAALGFVPIVRAVLPGVQIYVTCGPVPEALPSETPVAVLRQTQASVGRDGRILSAHEKPGVEVELHYLRGIIHRPLSAADIAETARRRGIATKELTLAHNYRVRTREVAPGVFHDTFRFTTAERPAFPAVLEVDTEGTNGPTRGIVWDIGSAITKGKAMRTHQGTSLRGVQVSEDEGLRRITLTGETTLADVVRPGPGASRVSGETLEELLDVGRDVVPNLGRLVRVTEERHIGGDLIQWSASFVSRVDWSVPHPDDDDSGEALGALVA